MGTTTETITYTTCGHTERRGVTGINSRDIAAKAAWMADTLTCAACRDTARQAADAARLAATANSDLTGTPKQVAWAEDIRTKQLAELTDEKIAHLARGYQVDETVIRGHAATLTGRTSAKAWIDTRGTSISLQIQDLMDED